MAQKTLLTLYVSELKDLYSAEQQLVKALPKLVKSAETDELSEAFANHLEETKNHVTRLEEVFESLGEKEWKESLRRAQRPSTNSKERSWTPG